MAAGTTIAGRGARQFQALFELINAGKVVNDFASAAANAGSTLSVTGVSGAALGDIVWVIPGVACAGTQYFGYVSAADTIEIRYQNGTAGAVDPASQTLRYIVLRPRGDFAI